MTEQPHPRHVAAPAEAILDEVERARFSPHPVGEDLRRDAIGALETLRIELEAPA